MHFEHTISIEADIQKVWDVTLDIANWPKWTPTVEAVQLVDTSALSEGSEVDLKQPGQALTRWKVTVLEPLKEFTWQAKRAGLMMVATHQLEQKEGVTHNTLRIEMKGVMAVILWPVLYFAIRKALVAENSGLKQWCETH